MSHLTHRTVTHIRQPKERGFWSEAWRAAVLALLFLVAAFLAFGF